MDAKISRSQISKTNDPHNWNSYDHYCTIHETRLADHSLVDGAHPNTLRFDLIESEGVLHLTQSGRVYCKHDIILEVEKWFETRYKTGRLQIRGLLYRYIAWIKNGHQILRHHNLHDNPVEYIHRAFNPKTGDEILCEVLKREQFPLFTEVLDEIELLTRDL